MLLSESAEITDIDRDSLHILPLAIIPLKTPGLRRARLIKNARLDTVIELFVDRQTGSGQMAVEAVAREFSWPEDKPHEDLIILRKLAPLPSYDVYSLRIQLRDLNIPVNDVDALKLSEKKNKELTSYMTAFTRPLITHIYGDDDVSIQKFEDIIRLFKDPDVKKALEKLKVMAAKLEIEPREIPKFLEDYGDTFLSLSYYKQCLDSISPVIEDFLWSLKEIRRNWQLKSDSNLMRTCDSMEATFTALMANITARFENFERHSKVMWDNLSAERFREVERLIQAYHVSIGGILCALTVKMDAWARLFPNTSAGGPMKRSEFIMSELKQGIGKMQELGRTAPKLAKTH
jgi:hypothetical protein